jgi:hypothetical protein
MNTVIIAPIFLLSLTFVVIILAFACPGPICTMFRAAFAPLRRLHHLEQQTIRRESGRDEQDATGEQEQHEQQAGR